MSTRTVAPAARGLQGELAVPSDKSIAHRALLLGAVADGATRIHGFPRGRDNRATLASGFIRVLGCDSGPTPTPTPTATPTATPTPSGGVGEEARHG